MSRHAGRARPFVEAVLLVLLALALAGCSQPKATITGKVTYKGEPVNAGTVSFFGPRDQVASAPIRPDGGYEVSGAPLGEVKITVTTPPPMPPPEQLANNPMVRERREGRSDVAPVAKTVSVPARYSRPGTSRLSLIVTEGSQAFDIELR